MKRIVIPVFLLAMAWMPACRSIYPTSTPPSGATPSATFSFTPTVPVTLTPTATTPVTFTRTPTDTPSASPTTPVTLTLTPTATTPVTFTRTPTDTPSASPTLPVTQTFTPTPTPYSCSQTIVWGDAVATPTGAVTINAGNTSCQKYALAQNSNLDKIAFVVNTVGQAGVSVAAGVYSDGGTYPATLIWSSAFQAVSDGMVVVSAPQVPLAAGNYWLAVSTNLSVLLSAATGSSSTRTWQTAVFPSPYINLGGPLPTPVSTPPPSSTTSIAGVFADICY